MQQTMEVDITPILYVKRATRLHKLEISAVVKQYFLQNSKLKPFWPS